MVVEALDAPFAHAREVRVLQLQRRADQGLQRQIVECSLGMGQEALGRIDVGVIGQKHEVIDQVIERRQPAKNLGHHRDLAVPRARTRASACLRTALQSAAVSLLWGLFKPSSNLVSSSSAALRFSSARISSRTYSLALL
jgi:hypothetical protein